MGATPSNYYVGPNPFSMEPPPQWWLNEMFLFDPKLVLVPGQRRMTFILARKATMSGGEPLHDERGVSQNPDTIFLNKHRLVRVCEILVGTVWDMRIFSKLWAHDIERQGGATTVADKLDAADQKRRETIQKDQETEIHARSVEAYKGYKMRIGERLSLAATPHGRGTLVKKPVSVHVQKPIPSASPIILAS